jgi:hypothetical protein
VVPDDDMQGLQMVAALGPVIQGYCDLLSLARELAERAMTCGRLGASDLALHRRVFETVEAQLACLRELQRQASATTPAGPEH